MASADVRQGRTVVYTDGACLGNPGPGGWAWLIPGGRWRSGYEEQTTNQRMELTAVLDALRALCPEGDVPVEVRSDSAYVVRCFAEGWWESWVQRGWRNSKGKPVANRDLWEPMLEVVRDMNVRFTWVEGHGDDPWNRLADRLAVRAAQLRRGEEGERASI